MRRRSSARVGFSLVEILVTIAIIAVLIAIALPVLGAARARARAAKSLVNTRTIAQQFEMYTSQHETYPHTWRGAMPPASFDDVGYEVPWYPPGWVSASSHYWDLSLRWPGLVEASEEWPAHIETWVSPGRERVLPEPPTGTSHEIESFVSYEYAHGFLGDPSLWTSRGVSEWRLARGIRPAEVSFPSGKVMIWDRHLGWAKPPEKREGHLDAQTPMAFTDGHADTLNPLDAAEGVANPLNDGAARRLHNTPDGVRGRDY
ncbi:MAG: hypothetical protein DHS20C14_10960 [Phycisphaeraceae bacterium]|nr:MAG: hypothetical protein DHS20C14_10960 [Phycisphaeraceae bacterium]